MAEVNLEPHGGPAGAVTFAGRRLISIALGAAVVGWVGLILGFVLARHATLFAYLTAFSFAASIVLGALVFLMTTYVVRAKWNTVVRRLNESIVSVFPLLALLFLPIALGLDELYLWAAPPAELPSHELHALHHRRSYLNEGFFLVRACAYFALWTLCAWVLSRWSLSGDARAASPAPPHAREHSFSSALLPLVALALTFASFDWLMSLQPLWVSTIFGVYYFSGGFVAALGLLAVLAHAARRGAAGAVIRPPHFYAIGRLLLGFTIFWAYIAFFQALLVRLPNRPEEVAFYRDRLEGGWNVVTWILVFARFVIPFFLLLPRSLKFDGRFVAAISALIIVGHYVDMYWLVLPIHRAHGALLNVWDICALVAVVAPCVAFAAWWLHGRSLVPVGDPLLAESIAYRSPL